MKKKIGCIFLAIFLSMLLSVNSFAAGKTEVDNIISSIPKEWPNAPGIGAKTAILMDADSGEILYAKNATDKIFPASTTKLMTALLALESSPLQDIVEFPFAATNIPAGSSHIGMRRGEQMIMEECLYGLLLPSANEVANAIALHVSETMEEFVTLMNERIRTLGGVNTSFMNPNGLHDEEHYTCSYDLALIMQACVQNSTFVEIASTSSYVHHADDLLPKDIPMTNTHQMIRTSEYFNENVVCGKTGHTAEAGYNLVTYAEKEGVHLIVVVTGCENGNQYVSTQSLLDYGFNYFHLVLPGELDKSLKLDVSYTGSPLSIPVHGAQLLEFDTTDSILLPENVTFDMLEKSVLETEDSIEITYLYEGYPLGSVRLQSEKKTERNGLFKKAEESSYEKRDIPDLPILDGWLLVFLGILILVFLIVVQVLKNMILPKRRHKKKKYKK